MSTVPRKRLAWVLLLAAVGIIFWQGTITYTNQTKLEEAEQRLDLALWGSDNGLFDWAAPGPEETWYDTHVWFSNHFKELMGFDRDTDTFPPVGKTFLGLVCGPEDRNNLIHAIDNAMRTHDSFDVIFQAQHRDGTNHWYTMRGRYSENGHGRVSGTLLDITPRMQERQRADLIILSAPEAVISCDSERRITMFNPAAEKMFGVKAEDMIGQHIDRIVTKEYLDKHNAVFAAAVERLRSHKNDWMVRRGDIEGEGRNATTGEVFPVKLCIRGIKYRGEMEFIARIEKVEAAPMPAMSMPLPAPQMMPLQMPKPKSRAVFK